MKPKVWVLVDNRIGNANQAIDLAQKLGEDFEIKHVDYNHFAKLPSTLLSIFPVHVKKSVLASFKKENIPEIIISAGRRTAALAVYLKKISNKETKIIQIMRPNLEARDFELIILPQHDNFNHTLSNVVRIIGALTNVKSKVQKGSEEFQKHYPDIKNFIAVLIGGSTKGYKLTMENSVALSNILALIAENHSLPLFISFSRRTPEKVRNYFKDKFTWPNIIYNPDNPAGGQLNPYPAMLNSAEYIISTTDSISMCSEAASTGKPVYVFCPANFKLKKHNFFIQQLVDLGLVRRLETTTSYLEKYEYEPLSEVTRVADIIKDKLLTPPHKLD